MVTSENAAPAEIPGVEEIARHLIDALRRQALRFNAYESLEDELSEFCGNGTYDGKIDAPEMARAILALFAPILAEKEAAEEQAESFKAMYRQAVDWRDEKIAKLTTRAEDAEFAMSRIEKAAASAEARALAAEAALAAERERCARIVENFPANHPLTDDDIAEHGMMPRQTSRADVAAAIRTQIAAPGAAMEAP